MEAIYPFAHVIHLILAIIFLGYVFSDVFIISAISKVLKGDTNKEVNQTLGKISFKIFPLSLLIIVLTGGMMMSKYINSSAGVFQTDMQKIFMFKIVLALVIVLGVLSNLFVKYTGRTKSNFMTNHFHKLVLVLGFFIVVSAKYMFLV
jgi:hypothetical protein